MASRMDTHENGFVIVAKDAEHLVVEFGLQKVERHVLCGCILLFALGCFFGGGYLLSPVINHSSLTNAQVEGIIFWVALCWACGCLVIFIARCFPHLWMLIINNVEGTIWLIFFYPFRREKKESALPIQDISKIYPHETNLEGNYSCVLMALLMDGRRVPLSPNLPFDQIDALDTNVRNFLDLLRRSTCCIHATE